MTVNGYVIIEHHRHKNKKNIKNQYGTEYLYYVFHFIKFGVELIINVHDFSFFFHLFLCVFCILYFLFPIRFFVFYFRVTLRYTIRYPFRYFFFSLSFSLNLTYMSVFNTWAKIKLKTK